MAITSLLAANTAKKHTQSGGPLSPTFASTSGGPLESVRQMEAMMEGMMSPLGPMLGAFPGLAPLGAPRRSASQALLPTFASGGFGSGLFPSVDDMFANIGRLSQDPSCHSFSSSSVMTVTTDGQGRPQVYQASQSTRTAPGGVKETRRSLQDSRSGVQELTIGHHLDERAHIVGRKRNQRTGHEDHNVQFINLDEEEAETFNHEWQQRAQRGMPRPHSMYAALPGRDSSSPLAITARGEASPSFEPYPDQQPRAEAASGRSDHRPKRRTKSKQRPRHETSM
ncbi:hypothetical protein ISCGN_007467 [Ixodes scapularis]